MIRTVIAGTALALLAAMPAAAAAADCKALVSAFQSARTTRSLEAWRVAEDALHAGGCDAEDETARDQLESFEFTLAGDASVDAAVRDDALADVKANGRSWQNAIALADRLFEQHKAMAASQLYDRAIALSGAPTAMSEPQRVAVAAKAGAAKLLASNDDEGRKPPTFARSLRGAHGAVGGVFSPALRGLARVKVPLPINFKSGTADFTPVGENAAAELVDALVQEKPAEITLIGHTDPRGSDQYNMQLSERRARRVAEFVKQALAAKHVAIEVHQIAKGKREPFDVSGLPIKPTEDERLALDRRVEFVR